MWPQRLRRQERVVSAYRREHPQTDLHGHNPTVNDAPSPQEPKAPTPLTPREVMEAKLLASPQCLAIVPGRSTAFFIRSPEELEGWKRQLGRSKRQG